AHGGGAGPGWSSQGFRYGQAGGEGVTAAGTVAAVQGSAVEEDPLAHADQAPAGPGTPVGPAGPVAVIAELKFHGGLGVAHHDGGPGVAGVLEGVGEAFLDDNVGSQVDACGQVHGMSFDMHGHWQPGVPDSLHERAQVAQAGAGSEVRCLLLRTGDSKQAAQLDEGLLAGDSMESNAWRASAGDRARALRPPPACPTMTLTVGATAAWISRALRPRSAASAWADSATYSAASCSPRCFWWPSPASLGRYPAITTSGTQPTRPTSTSTARKDHRGAGCTPIRRHSDSEAAFMRPR